MPRTTTGRVAAGVYVLVVTVLGILAFTIPDGDVAFLWWDIVVTFPASFLAMLTFWALGAANAALGVNAPEWLSFIWVILTFAGAACLNVWLAGSLVAQHRLERAPGPEHGSRQ